jgi:hypothetical protein
MMNIDIHVYLLVKNGIQCSTGRTLKKSELAYTYIAYVIHSPTFVYITTSQLSNGIPVTLDKDLTECHSSQKPIQFLILEHL